MATLLYRYNDNQIWATYAPSIMTIKRAHTLKNHLIAMGYQVKIKPV